jgi:hypothetical protein
VLTLVALPVLYAENRSTQNERPTAVAAAGLGDAIVLGGSSSPSETSASTTNVAEPFLAPPVTLAPTSTDAPKEIAVRAPAADTVVQARGTYKQWPDGWWVANPCDVPGAPNGETITVENIDNGFTAQCINMADEAGPGPGEQLEVVLDTDVFLGLADLAEAPVPLQLSW